MKPVRADQTGSKLTKTDKGLKARKAAIAKVKAAVVYEGIHQERSDARTHQAQLKEEFLEREAARRARNA